MSILEVSRIYFSETSEGITGGSLDEFLERNPDEIDRKTRDKIRGGTPERILTETPDEIRREIPSGV